MTCRVIMHPKLMQGPPPARPKRRPPGIVSDVVSCALGVVAAVLLGTVFFAFAFIALGVIVTVRTIDKITGGSP
jgi:hypothetical protein